DRHGPMMEQSNAGQGDREKNELDGNRGERRSSKRAVGGDGHWRRRKSREGSYHAHRARHPLSPLTRDQPGAPPIATTICTRYGPWAPSTIVCSISPVREGPDTILMARGIIRSTPPRSRRISSNASSIVATMRDDSTSAICVSGSKWVDAGDSGLDSITSV